MKKFCNLPINILSERDFFDWKKNDFKHYCTLNAQIIRLSNEDKKMYNIVNGTYNSIDGTWPFWVFKVLNKTTAVKKISGSDYLPRIIERCLNLEKRIFFLGGTDVSNQKVVNDINFRKSGLAEFFSGPIESYPFSDLTQSIIIQRIENFRPEILIVSYGAPKQEFWISDNAVWLKEAGIRAAYGLGGSVDMMFTPRLKAPTIVSRLGLESIWRIIAQPLYKKRWKRLFYSVGFFKFIFSSNFE